MKLSINKGRILALAAAVVLLLQLVGIKINLPYVNEIIEAVCGILIVLGLVYTTKEDEADKPPEDIEGAEDNKDDNDDVCLNEENIEGK